MLFMAFVYCQTCSIKVLMKQKEKRKIIISIQFKMLTHELVIPFICAYCQNIALLFKPENESGIQLLDFFNSRWRQHTCATIKGKSLFDDNLIKALSELKWGIRKIPRIAGLNQKTRQKRLSKGIILSIPQDGEQHFIKVLTLENTLIDIKTVKKSTDLSAGLLIDLSGAVRTGHRKFRLSKITQLLMRDELNQSSDTQKEFYQFLLTANDQEKLEVFVDRLTKTLLKQKSSPYSVVPTPITRSEAIEYHHRRVIIRSEPDILKNVENISLPESFRISIKQIST